MHLDVVVPHTLGTDEALKRLQTLDGKEANHYTFKPLNLDFTSGVLTFELTLLWTTIEGSMTVAPSYVNVTSKDVTGLLGAAAVIAVNAGMRSMLTDALK